MISDVYRFILEVRPLLKTLDLTGCPCLTRGLAQTYETIQQIALLREYLSILELINKLISKIKLFQKINFYILYN